MTCRMKKLLLTLMPLALIAIILFGTNALANQTSKPTKGGGTVYICNSQGSYAYHSSKGCAALNRCSSSIKAVSAASAKSQGRSACQKCY